MNTSKRDTLIGAGLGFLAGYVDTVGFVALFGLFTAHVTGNFVLIGSALAQQSHGELLIKFLAFPAFVGGVAVTRLLTVALEQRRQPAALFVLAMQLLMLCGVMAAGIAASPITDSNTLPAMLAGLLAAAAMGVQNANNRLLYQHLTPTTVMTGNVTQLVIDLVDIACGNGSPSIRARCAKFFWPVVAFGLGAIGGAFAYIHAGFICLLLPIAILTVIMEVERRALLTTGS